MRTTAHANEFGLSELTPELVQVFRRLGVRRPENWALSQAEEGRYCPLMMRQASAPIPLTYGVRGKRRITLAPVVVAVAHFAVTYAVWRWCLNRLAAVVFAALRRHPGDPLPSLTLADRIGQAVESILLLPIRGIGLPRVAHVAIPPVIFIAADSVLWGIACWLLIRWRRRARAIHDLRG